jgi:exopolyphosphatase/guanosine-5'-triphosphate,3'-diphosphate pyrophosphatase
VTISSYGLREGLLYRQMPESMRALDPLIEACRHMELISSRCPGFGDALFDWLAPLYPDAAPDELRLIRAACLLHDVNWRAHPDHRAELCFESVLRANFAGVNHAERTFLGLALLSRYKANATVEDASRYAALIAPDRAKAAAALGRAIRLGAMLSGAALGVLEHARLGLQDGRLRLTLTGVARDLAGEAVERRLAGLASRFGAEWEIVAA